MFSVVIPLYNKKQFICNTISSVLEQSFQDFELIIVDDGSTDGSDLIVESIIDPRILFLKKSNGGVSSARNLGISKSSRPYTAFLDADDLWDTEFLKKMSELILDHPDCDIFASSFNRRIDGKACKPLHKNVPFTRGRMHNYFELQRIFFYPLICSSAVIIKREKLLQTGMFNEQLSSGEDLDLWYRIILSGNIAYLNEPLATYCDIPDHMRASDFRFRNNIVFNLSHFNTFEIENPSFKRYLDKFRLKALRRFYLSDVNESDVRSILEQIPLSEFSVYDKVLYKVAPKRVLKILYSLNNGLKRLQYRFNR